MEDHKKNLFPDNSTHNFIHTKPKLAQGTVTFLFRLRYGEISQAAISAYERNRSLPSILDVQILATACEQRLGSIPWDDFDLSMEKKQNWLNLKQERFDLAELPLADSVRTFDGKIYQLHGRIAIE